MPLHVHAEFTSDAQSSGGGRDGAGVVGWLEEVFVFDSNGWVVRVRKI